jgi:UDP-glucose 4-epimerase
MGQLRGRTVLITGVAGFIGRYAARYFSELGWSVIGVDQVQQENGPLQNLSAYHCIQLPDKKLAGLLGHFLPQVCIHCAGPASVGLSMEDPSMDFYSSTVLTFEILNMLRLYCPASRFILISSAAVYGNPSALPIGEDQPLAPISPYGFHKYQCEQLCQEFAKVYGLSTASGRVFSAYGTGLRRQVIWDICEKVTARKSLELHGSGRESRDFVHAVDIVKALFVIAETAPMEGEAYNIGSGRQVFIAELADMILRMLGSECRPHFDGIAPHGNPLNWQADISKIGALGFAPEIGLEEGIKSFVNWRRSELAKI